MGISKDLMQIFRSHNTLAEGILFADVQGHPLVWYTKQSFPCGPLGTLDLWCAKDE